MVLVPVAGELLDSMSVAGAERPLLQLVTTFSRRIKKLRFKQVIAPPMAVRLAADLRPAADGSAVRTSLVAGSSVPMACSHPTYSLGWDRQTDRQDGRIAVSLNAPLGGGIITLMALFKSKRHGARASPLTSRTLSRFRDPLIKEAGCCLRCGWPLHGHETSAAERSLRIRRRYSARSVFV